MSFLPERTYRIVYVGTTLAFLFYLFMCSDIVRAEEFNADTAKTAAICAATNRVIGDKAASSIVIDEAVWWTFFLREYVENEAAADLSIAIAVKNLEEAYATGDGTWSELIELGQQCNNLHHTIVVMTQQ